MTSGHARCPAGRTLDTEADARSPAAENRSGCRWVPLGVAKMSASSRTHCRASVPRLAPEPEIMASKLWVAAVVPSGVHRRTTKPAEERRTLPRRAWVGARRTLSSSLLARTLGGRRPQGLPCSREDRRTEGRWPARWPPSWRYSSAHSMMLCASRFHLDERGRSSTLVGHPAKGQRRGWVRPVHCRLMQRVCASVPLREERGAPTAAGSGFEPARGASR